MPSIRDITGQRFGRLVAVRRTGEMKQRSSVWECKCDCGKRTFVILDSLQRGVTNSCGCFHRELLTKDMAGKRFGKLIAIRPTAKRKFGRIFWECKCDCGVVKNIDGSYLRNGSTKSCGCSRYPIPKEKIPKRKTFTYDEVVKALVDNQGFVTHAAKDVGVEYRTFIIHCERIGIDPHGYRVDGIHMFYGRESKKGYDYQKDVIRNAQITACEKCKTQLTARQVTTLCKDCPNKAEGWN
jgi:hypothetical protein